MALYDYRIGAGHNVALVNLSNIENDLSPYVRGRFVAPHSQPVNLYPVRTKVFSGQVRGDGTINHSWTFDVLTKEAVKYLVETYFSSGATVSAAVTIYTRRHELDTYARYNAYAELFIPGETFTYDRTRFRGVQLIFHKLTTPS